MDAFESVIATILQNEGFWVQVSFKVKLKPEDKVEMGSPCSPRWELDVVAYKPGENLLRVVECKSYLDSPGVRLIGFDPASKKSSRFKLFNRPNTREVVLRCLVQRLVDSKSILPDPKIELCLAAGKIVASDKAGIQSHFDKNGWQLFDRDWIRQRLLNMNVGSYENHVAAMTVKLLESPDKKSRRKKP